MLFGVKTPQVGVAVDDMKDFPAILLMDASSSVCI